MPRLFVHQFGTGNTSFGSGLIEEINDCGTQCKMFVHRPVDTTESFPTPVEVVSIFNVSVRLAEIAEAGPDSEVVRNVVAGIEFDKHFRNLRHNISRGIDFTYRTVLESHTRFIFLVSRALVGKQEMEVEAFERFDHCIRRPADGLDVITQRSGKNLGPVIRINQIERRVIVCFRNVGKQRSQANPVRVIIDPGTSQGTDILSVLGIVAGAKFDKPGRCVL